MKITRIELCHPVNRPGKSDDVLRSIKAEKDKWSLTIEQHIDIGPCVLAVCSSGGMYIPMSNIKSIDYEEKKK